MELVARFLSRLLRAPNVRVDWPGEAIRGMAHFDARRDEFMHVPLLVIGVDELASAHVAFDTDARALANMFTENRRETVERGNPMPLGRFSPLS